MHMLIMNANMTKITKITVWQSGWGTNRNERLHSDIKAHMTSTHYGVELSYAILKKKVFSHNDSKMEKRTPRPITAYSYCGKQTGFSTPPEVSQMSMDREPCASQSKIQMRRLTHYRKF